MVLFFKTLIVVTLFSSVKAEGMNVYEARKVFGKVVKIMNRAGRSEYKRDNDKYTNTTSISNADYVTSDHDPCFLRYTLKWTQTDHSGSFNNGREEYWESITRNEFSLTDIYIDRIYDNSNGNYHVVLRGVDDHKVFQSKIQHTVGQSWLNVGDTYMAEYRSINFISGVWRDRFADNIAKLIDYCEEQW